MLVGERVNSVGSRAVKRLLLKDDYDETKGWSAAKLYSEAKSNLTDRNYEQAIKYYQKLEARYPYGRFAQQEKNISAAIMFQLEIRAA